MPRSKNEPELINVPDSEMRKVAPRLDPVAREKQMVSLATDLAEKQLRDGTAAPSTINHYLKIGSTREFLEREILEKQKALIQAKADSLESAQETKKIYQEAMDAMKAYSPSID